MTAAEHLALGEKMLDLAMEQGSEGYVHEERNLLLRGLVHLVAAVAIELGVPPVTPAATGGSSG
jgi:hypothetical protein